MQRLWRHWKQHKLICFCLLCCISIIGFFSHTRLLWGLCSLPVQWLEGKGNQCSYLFEGIYGFICCLVWTFWRWWRIQPSGHIFLYCGDYFCSRYWRTVWIHAGCPSTSGRSLEAEEGEVFPLLLQLRDPICDFRHLVLVGRLVTCVSHRWNPLGTKSVSRSASTTWVLLRSSKELSAASYQFYIFSGWDL